MPLTSSRSSTDVNGPCSDRWSRIAWAVTGPMPGKGVELLERGRRETDARARRPNTSPPAGSPGSGFDTDEDLLAVGEDARHVEGRGVDLAAHSPGLGDRLVHP